jgi:prepilin-type N-terminal cleavage/methylation domain-containing protein
MRRADGFTLFELLIVLVLIGLAGSLAVSSVDRIAGRSEETRWVDRTQQELLRLRNRAVFAGLSIQAEVDFIGGEIRLAGTAPQVLVLLPSRYAFAPVMPELPPGAAPVAPPDVAVVVFNPDGTATDLHFALLLPNSYEQRFRVTGATGRIERIERTDAPRT